ncbi:MAG TPA: 3-oxoacyl-[acyl-carrier-protein] reductase [Actinobacteria bacterium]|nr:3-oxoacyl-[acyl-carrier-protein] reductase [Actinomycetota bacterium]
MVSRVALVTGGSRGIGRAIALLLAEHGHHVAVNYSKGVEAAEAVVDSIIEHGGEAIAVQADVGSADAVTWMFQRVGDRLGPVDVLVNNAGITRDSLLLRMNADTWDEVIRTNLTSVYLCTKQALRSMVRARWGRIITIGSVAGLAGNPGQANYAATKAAIVGFTKSVAKEVGSRGITANVVAPGFVETDLTADLSNEMKEAAAASIALRRWGTPAEIASAVRYLASDEASYISGHVLVVDGGLAL